MPVNGCRLAELVECGQASVWRGPFYAIDHPDLDRAFGGIELQSELLLNSREEARRVGIDRWRRRTGRELPRLNLGLELELELPVAGQPRAIDDGASDAAADASREQFQWIVSEPNSAGSLLEGADTRRTTEK